MEIGKNRIRAEKLVKIYGKRRVVNELSIEIGQGEVVGVLGPNGAGKTTSFYMIIGLTKPNEGKVWFNDQEITKWPMYKRARLGISYLAQAPSIFHKLTVEENIMSILETLKISKKELIRRLEEHLDELGLTKLAKQKAYTLSGGERRKLEITRSLVTNPSFLFMDEPFAGVDPIAISDIQNIVMKLKEKNIGILVTDHNVLETLKIVSRAYIVNEGQVLISGDSKQLVNDETVRQVYLGNNFMHNPLMDD
ncbi:MAG: LPS export ABC transporter ATP-binding protein [Candidatus Zophobacter franzmannii]|nr:LPS export ABC transporter ATP-binding protein [Candidatus Zophobacter franzmannii]